MAGQRLVRSNLEKEAVEQAERRESEAEQPHLITETRPYLVELEGLVETRIEDAGGDGVLIPAPEVEAWTTLLEPVGEMTAGQFGYDIHERIAATIAEQAERHAGA